MHVDAAQRCSCSSNFFFPPTRFGLDTGARASTKEDGGSGGLCKVLCRGFPWPGKPSRFWAPRGKRSTAAYGFLTVSVVPQAVGRSRGEALLRWLWVGGLPASWILGPGGCRHSAQSARRWEGGGVCSALYSLPPSRRCSGGMRCKPSAQYPGKGRSRLDAGPWWALLGGERSIAVITPDTQAVRALLARSHPVPSSEE